MIPGQGYGGLGQHTHKEDCTGLEMHSLKTGLLAEGGSEDPRDEFRTSGKACVIQGGSEEYTKRGCAESGKKCAGQKLMNIRKKGVYINYHERTVHSGEELYSHGKRAHKLKRKCVSKDACIQDREVQLRKQAYRFGEKWAGQKGRVYHSQKLNRQKRVEQPRS